MGWGILEAHLGDCRMFETMVSDDYEAVAMVWMNKELEKETRDIDNREKALSLYCFDNVLL